MEDAKLQNLIVESAFFFSVAINKALPVSNQSFTSFVYKIKHIQAERYDILPKNRSGFGAKNVGPKCSGAISIDHYCSESCCCKIKDK